MSSNGQRPPLCGLTEEQVDALQAPLDPAHVKERELKTRGKSVKLSYIEGHHAIREANRIFGPGGWTRDSSDMRLVHEGQWRDNEGSTLAAYTCRVTIKVRTEDGWITSDGWGYGEGIDYNNPGQAHESAVKEAETDAMKRALSRFGDPFGLALYDKARENVAPPPPEMPPGIDEDGNPQTLVGLSNALKLEGLPPDTVRDYAEQAAETLELAWEYREEFGPDDLQQIRDRAIEICAADQEEAREATA